MHLIIFLVELISASSRANRNQRLLQEKLVKSFLSNQFPDLLVDENPFISDEDIYHWMEVNRDTLNNKKLNEIYIPGAHDAAMNTKGSHFKTQALTINDLLMSGVRFLDLRTRVRKRNGRLITYHYFSGALAHGGIGDSIYLNEVMDQIDNFLFRYPREVVIVKIKPYISNDAEKANYENLITQAMPPRLVGITLRNNNGINQKYGDLITMDKRFIIIYESDNVQAGGILFSNQGRRWLYSDAPKSGEYVLLIAGLEQKLPVKAETANLLALFHWTITGGNIYDNTVKYVSNMDDFQRKAWAFDACGKRVNVVMMDFCSFEKAKRIIEMNIQGFRPPEYPLH